MNSNPLFHAQLNLESNYSSELARPVRISNLLTYNLNYETFISLSSSSLRLSTFKFAKHVV